MTSKRQTGRYERVTTSHGEVDAFVPHPLPPTKPALRLDGTTAALLRDAEHELARLELAGEMVPSLDWFIYGFVRKEAVLSSQIEGTQASLVDLLEFEAGRGGAATPDVEEVSNYLAALTYARAQLTSPTGRSLSMQLLGEAHKRLLRGTRGHSKLPGKVRRSQNWIGSARPQDAKFVPPPPDRLPELLGAFETYLHSSDDLPPLVRAGLAHVQFETLHPFLDGNGRIGRLLVTLLLEHWRLLTKPLLYLSLFFKRRREEYYALLNAVRTDGDWEAWTAYFLEGVATIASEAVTSARELFAIVTSDRGKVLEHGTSSVAAARLFESLARRPIVTVASAMELLDTTKPTASRAVQSLVESGVLHETTGKKRDRSFAYRRYLAVLQVGTELRT